jgi:hypothetical protein
MCWDKELVKIESGRKRSINKEHILSLEDIVETKSGFKYKSPKQKIFIIGLGLGFFEGDAYTNEEIAAVIFHECGHSFQQMMIGINMNIADHIIGETIRQTYQLFNIFTMAFTLGLTGLLGLIEMAEIGHSKKHKEETATNAIKAEYKEWDRDKLGKSVTDNTTDSAAEVASEGTKKRNFFMIIGKFIVDVILGLGVTVFYLISPILWIVNIPRNLFLAGNVSFLRKNKKFEQFADMFAANYALGPQLASALSKLGEHSKINLFALNWLNYVPILNVALNVGHYAETAAHGLLTGYPTTKKRVVGVYNTCKFEIDNNKDLTPKDKQELMAQMDRIEGVYNEFVFGTGTRNFVYNLWHRILGKKINNEQSDIKSNVLQSLKEMKDEAKLLEATSKEKTKEFEDLENESEFTSKKAAFKGKLISFLSRMRINRLMDGISDSHTNIIKAM